MSEKETGGQAFPTPGLSQLPNGDVIWPEAGAVTLRDYFAAKALAALTEQEKATPNTDMIAAWVYQIADAMIAERSK